MVVPLDDVVCRFVRPSDWSRILKRPKPGAFKQVGLSVWHPDRLEERDATLDDLRIEHLAGYGQAHHTVGDYYRFARKSEEKDGTPFRVQVKWRPDDEFVDEPWRQWRYAHIQVETVAGPAQFTVSFRNLLALKTKVAIAPDG